MDGGEASEIGEGGMGGSGLYQKDGGMGRGYVLAERWEKISREIGEGRGRREE